jgi:glucan phosphorylase
MSDVAKTEKGQLSRAVESERERRREQAKRIVQRLLHSHLAQAFDSFHDRVAQSRDKKAKCKRIIQRLQHTHLAAAFAWFAEGIRLLVAHRTTVKKAISRWRTPVVNEMFERWLEYLDDVKQKVKEDEHAQAMQQLADELETARSFFHLAKWYI